MTAVVGGWMKTNEVMRELGRDTRRPSAPQGEWSGIGWTDSSWDLMHGLEVVEDLPPHAWPIEFQRGLMPTITAPQKN